LNKKLAIEKRWLLKRFSLACFLFCFVLFFFLELSFYSVYFATHSLLLFFDGELMFLQKHT